MVVGPISNEAFVYVDGGVRRSVGIRGRGRPVLVGLPASRIGVVGVPDGKQLVVVAGGPIRASVVLRSVWNLSGCWRE